MGWREESLAGEDFLCSICLQPFHRPITLRCAHSFCRHCILKALKSSPCCPLCRSPHSYEGLFEYSENKLLKKLTTAFKEKTSSLNDNASLKKQASTHEKESLVWVEEKKRIEKLQEKKKRALQFRLVSDGLLVGLAAVPSRFHLSMWSSKQRAFLPVYYF